MIVTRRCCLVSRARGRGGVVCFPRVIVVSLQFREDLFCATWIVLHITFDF